MIYTWRWTDGKIRNTGIGQWITNSSSPKILLCILLPLEVCEILVKIYFSLLLPSLDVESLGDSESLLWYRGQTREKSRSEKKNKQKDEKSLVYTTNSNLYLLLLCQTFRIRRGNVKVKITAEQLINIVLRFVEK